MENVLKEYVRAIVKEEFERAHMSKKKIRQFKDIPTQLPGMKPEGFWYDCDGEWSRWIDSEMPHWKGKHNYKVQVDLSKMIVIRNYKQLKAFEEKYGIKKPYGDGYMEIDWPKVAQNYSGIEIAPYIQSARFSVLWYYGWDVASGCIWEKSALKNVEKT